MRGYLRIMRILNCFMIAIAVLMGSVLASKFEAFFAWQTWMAMAAAFLINGAGNAINDYVDVEADRINRPQRPIIAGQISKRGALLFSILLFAAGILLSAAMNYLTLAIAAFNSLLLVIYSTHLKSRLFVGNIAISYMVGSGFLFGGAAAGNIQLTFLLLLLAFFANMSREIVKSLEDMEGDRMSFLKRAASKVKEKIAQRFGLKGKKVELRFGVRKMKIMAVVFLLLAVAVSPVPYVYGILGLVYLALLVPTDLVFLLSAYRIARASRKGHYRSASRVIKLGMLLGLIAFIAGALVYL